jgi:hypothetical protein
MRRIRLLVVLGIVCAVLAVPCLIFMIRPPVLIVTEAPFAALYGEANLRRQRNSASLALFRQVKPVKIADGVSHDMVIYAISEGSSRPFCVLFPYTQAQAALRFHEQFPEIPAVVLSGLASVSGLSPDGFLCVYGTDREADLYRAGLCAGILGGVPLNPEKQAEIQGESAARIYVLWQDRFVQAAGRELFSRGVKEEDPESDVLFINTAAQMPDVGGISCVTLIGTGAEYLEKNPSIPLILFTWLDPALTAQEVAVQFDDSPWALAVPAVRMAVQQEAEGKIPSNPLIFSGKTADNTVSRALKKSVKKMP